MIWRVSAAFPSIPVSRRSNRSKDWTGAERFGGLRVHFRAFPSVGGASAVRIGRDHSHEFVEQSREGSERSGRFCEHFRAVS